MNVLVSSAGRRVALVEIVKQALAPRGGHVHAVDASLWSSACRVADSWSIVPRCTKPEFVPAVLDACREHDIQLIIPTIDTELPVYAAHKAEFEAAGVTVAVSEQATIDITFDKWRTQAFLEQEGFPAARSFHPDEIADLTEIPFPLVIKPRNGSCSKDVYFLRDREELDFYIKRVPEPIIQTVAGGDEFTINFFVNRSGRCLAAVPHQRLETRGGEVSKCLTRKLPSLMELADRLAARLPGAWGALCFQAFVDGDDIAIIEINPRFGGGYPVAHRAGANFVEYLIQTVEGNEPTEPFQDWTDRTVMMRWDSAVFLTEQSLKGAA